METLRELNYSEHELKTLDESNLDESAGVSQLSSGYTGILRFFNAQGANTGIGAEAGRIDWTGNGLIDTGTVSVDLNRLNGTTEIMKGYADWVHGTCNQSVDCPVNAIRQNIHDNIDPSIDPLEPCVRNRCQSLWIPLQLTPWGKED